MGARVSYTLVGLFVVLLAVGLVAAGLWLSGGLERPGEMRRYSVYMTESVAGLSPAARVSYKGVDVGKVVQVAIDRDDPKRVRVILAVKQTTPVSATTVAAIKAQGLTGATSIELTGYDPSAPAPATPPGEPYPVIQTKSSPLTHLDQAVSEGINTINQLGKQLTDLLSRPNRQAVSETLANFARLSDTLAGNSERIDQAMANLQRVTRNTARITGELLPQTLQRLDRTLQAVDALSQSLNQTAERLTALGRSGETGVNRVLRTTLPELEALFGDIRQTTGHLDRLIQKLEREPAALLRGAARQSPGPGEQ